MLSTPTYQINDTTNRAAIKDSDSENSAAIPGQVPARRWAAARACCISLPGREPPGPQVERLGVKPLPSRIPTSLTVRLSQPESQSHCIHCHGPSESAGPRRVAVDRVTNQLATGAGSGSITLAILQVYVSFTLMARRRRPGRQCRDSESPAGGDPV